MNIFENFHLTFMLAAEILLAVLVLLTIIIGLQKIKRKELVIKIFSQKGAHYFARALQFFAVLWFAGFVANLTGIPLGEYLKEPFIESNHVRITPYTLILIVSELIFVLIIRQLILYLIRVWQQSKELKPSQMRTLLTVLDILLWGGAILITLSVMHLPVKTLFAFPLITFKDNNTLTVGNVISIILVFSLTNWFLSVLQEIFLNIGQRDPESRPRRKTMFTVFKYLVWVLIIILSLETMGVKISVLVASSAALFVGIGLGIQDIFKDLISGVFLHFEKNLTQGDVIESKGIVGEVKEMGLRTTKIMTRDNIFMMIPNHQFISEPIINWSHANQNTRFNVEVGVAYGSDVHKVEEILLKCASGHKKIANSPKPFVRFLNFGNSSLDFQLFFWTEKTFIVENIKSDIRFLIYQAFAENGIQIPFPQQDVYIKEFTKPEGAQKT
ncbi:MAG: hypothetical protein C0593_14480 [Marinilabiliales bacterium]|nr:MAG: hypothetical protein C0593_14480 [Marinilabiliales bacterium]